MSLFSPRKEPFSTDLNPKLFGYNVQTSLSGTVIPLGYGQFRVSGNIIWTGDWQAKAINGSGKLFSKGGGKGGPNSQQFDYKTALMIGLCQGQITGLGHIWVNKIQYNLNGATQIITVPPGGGSITPTYGSNMVQDTGPAMLVSYSHTANDYGSPGPVTMTGQMLVPMVKVSSSPASGQYVLNPATGTYTFSAADAGATIQINYTWADNNSSYDGNPTTQLQFSAFLGSQGQFPWGYLTTNHPDQAIGYTELAYLANQLVDLGEAGVLQNYNFEITGLFPFGGGITDANPAAIIPDFLSHPTHGAGFPIAALGSLTQLSNYCIANGIFISPLLNQQRSAATILDDWCKICNCAPVWSEGLLKFIPYGDTTVIGNGATFTPNTTPIYDLDDSDFLAKEGDPPLKISRTSVWDSYNSVKVQWTNRGNLYTQEPIEEKDDLSIGRYGLRPAPTYNLEAITNQLVAQQVANIALKNLVYKRKTYTFNLSAVKYCLLEPMDLVTISDFYIGLDKVPIRIIEIAEDENLWLKITAEEFPWGTATPTLNPKQSTAPFGPGYFSRPGSINPPFFFEATAEMTQDVLYTLLIAISGTRNWGGCNVHVSTDGGQSYTKIGSQMGPTTMGYLTAPLPSNADPDTTDILAVNLTECLGALDSFTQAQADKFLSLVLVDQELLSYSTATMTGSYQYNLNYLRRGVYATAITQHPTNAPFAVLDDSAFSWQYTADMIGRTLYFKFTSFNTAGQQEEQISHVEAFPYFVHGPHTPYPLAPNDPGTVTLSPSAGAVLRSPNFGVRLSSYTNPGGVAFSRLIVSTEAPVNVFTSVTIPPTILSLTTASSGGTIAGGQVVTVGVPGLGSDGLYTPMALASIEIPPGTNTNTVTVTVGFANPGIDTGLARITNDPDQGWWGPAGTVLGILTNSYTFTQIGQLNDFVPVPEFDHFVVQARTAIKFGVWGLPIGVIVDNLDGTSTISFTNVDGSPSCSFTVGQFVGRVLTCYGKNDPTLSVPICDVLITASGVSSVTTANIASFAHAGDLVCAWMQATSFGPSLIGDSNIINNAGGVIGGGGLVPHAWKGQLIMIVKGTGSNSPPVIVADNDATSFTMATPFEVTPDATSVFMLLNAAVEWSVSSGALAISDPGKVITQALTVGNDWRHYFVQVLIADVNGDLSLPEYSPWRLIFSNGLPPNLTTRKTVIADYTVLVSDQVLLCDSSAGPITITLLSGSILAGQVLYIKKISSDTNIITIQAPAGEFIDGSTTQTLVNKNDNIQLLGNG